MYLRVCLKHHCCLLEPTGEVDWTRRKDKRYSLVRVLGVAIGSRAATAHRGDGPGVRRRPQGLHPSRIQILVFQPDPWSRPLLQIHWHVHHKARAPRAVGLHVRVALVRPVRIRRMQALVSSRCLLPPHLVPPSLLASRCDVFGPTALAYTARGPA
jgi:hypothetical protein